MENNYTVVKYNRNSWLVKDEYGETIALLENYTYLKWWAFDWEHGERLFIGEENVYTADWKETAAEIAQKIEY